MTNETAKPNMVSAPKPFEPQRIEGWMAILAFALGYLFLRLVFFAWQGWGVTLFAFLYAGYVISYMKIKRRVFTTESYFWLAILLLTALSFTFFDARGLQPWREFFLFAVAIYWVLNISGMTLLGTTSDWLPLDFLQGLVIIPFGNFGLQYKSLALLKTKKSGPNKQLWQVVLGLFLAVLFTIIVMPLLFEADSGGFMNMVQGIWEHISWLRITSIESVAYILLSIPTAAYLYGLIAGSAHGRGGSSYQPEKVEKMSNALRILPATTVLTMLAAINLLYFIFISSQVPYFFSAFVGARPQEWQVYSAYARNGFFELCGIAVLNLSVFTGANIGIRQESRKHVVLKALNIMLSLFTLLLIATAFSKMALYISVYGLSVKRVLPCVLMLFLGLIWGAIIALQSKHFSLMRLAAFAGAIMLSILSLVNIDGVVCNYNATRYMNGTLTDFDVTILFRSGPAGVDAALKVYNWTNDEELKTELSRYLYTQLDHATVLSGTARDTVQSRAVRRKVASLDLGKRIPGYDYPIP